MTPHRRKRRDLRTMWLYARGVLREFRVTLVGLVVVLAAGAALYQLAPPAALEDRAPSWGLSIYGAWMALFAQPIFARPDAWYLQLMHAVYPLLGLALVGEGIVRLALLMVSRRHGEKEWMLVMASTYRHHVVVCGLGHLGYRVLEQLLAQGREVVAIEKDAAARFVAVAKAAGVPVLVRDMKEDEALVAAGVAHAEAIVIATSDDLANVEVAMDARRLNPKIRTAVRLFDQQMAGKLRDAFAFDAPFSSSALAAPAVAAMTLGCKVVAAFALGDQPHVAAELVVERRSPVVGTTIAGLEGERGVRVLSRRSKDGAVELPPRASTVVDDDDALTVHVAVARLGELARLFRPARSGATPDRS
jgi:Trk K+ transport system NAD-binding subunit